MTGAPLQRFGGMIMLQSVAVADAYYLLSVGLRTVRRGATPIPSRFLLLQAELAAAAAEVRASATGQHDVAPVAPQPHSEGEDNIGTVEAAGILRLSHRQVQRIAADLDGRFVGGCWCFDRLAVQSYAAHRDEHRTNPAA
jgi:hypothetical protein